MEEEINSEQLDENEIERKEELEKEKQEFISKVLSGNIETKHDKVGFILNNYTIARNSDVELTWLYWKTFEEDKFNGSYVTKEDLKKLTRMNSLTRSRARIQNDYKLFQADKDVQKSRGVLSKEYRDEAIAEKPKGLPIYSVYIDETGKTQDYISVGSLWIIDGFKAFQANRHLEEWLERNNIQFEFHFSEVTNHKLDIYKGFFLKYLELNPTIGFKAIVLNKRGIRDINAAITDLTYHLISKGINHENITGRAPLPRLLQVWLDEEEKGTDLLKIENLRERITSQNISDLYLGDFSAVNSKRNYSIQAVDLFTASINRRIHNFGNQRNAKDELADYILGLLNFNVADINLENTATDNSIVFNLEYGQ